MYFINNITEFLVVNKFKGIILDQNNNFESSLMDLIEDVLHNFEINEQNEIHQNYILIFVYK